MSRFEGSLVEIHVTAEKGGAPGAVQEVEAVAGVGLRGDRYGRAAAPEPMQAGDPRAVTLIEVEALEALAADHDLVLSAAESRRNLATRGVPLNHLVGRRFMIGAVRLRGTELCEPCGYLEKATGKPVRAPLVHRGGLRAEVLVGGVLRVGDPIVPLD